MFESKLAKPVAFIIFNRPEPTRAVFARIRAAQPPRLLVIADGPRDGRPGEPERCRAARAVIDGIDWPCEVSTNYSDVNLGCRNRVASGIDWVFQNVEEAIILEDDCVPHPTFFRFCAELLDRYRDDRRIGMIAGTNAQAGIRRGGGSYYLSKYTPIWGWATWRRAWAYYDRTAAVWPEFRSSGAFDAVARPKERPYWAQAFDGVHRGSIDTWDYQWILSCWTQGMLSVIPNQNLISNIGFGPDATHTRTVDEHSNLDTSPMTFPLVHPRVMVADEAADRLWARSSYDERFRGRVRRHLKEALLPILGALRGA